MNRILVIEDNEMNRELANTLLTSHGYETVLADSGEIGVSLFQQHDIDLILMDLQLPGIDGFETFKQIQPLMRKPIPVVAVTGNATPADIEKVRLAGFDDILTKPFHIKELTDKVALYLAS